MAFVAAATSVGAAVLGTGAAAGIGSTIVGGALIGAGVGGLYSAITGDGNILNSMLTGGIIGGAGAGLAGAAGAGAGSAASLPSSAAVPTANVATVTPAMQAAALDTAAVAEGGTTAGMVEAANTGLPAGTSLPPGATDVIAKTGSALTGKEMLGYGLAGSAALSLLGSRKPGSAGAAPDPGDIRPYTYSQTINPKYGLPGEPYYVQSYEAGTPYKAKAGGLMSFAYGGPVERMSALDQDQGMYPQGMMDKTYYATPSQRPASMEVIKSDYDTPVNPITGIGPQFAGGGMVSFANGGVPAIPPVDPIAMAPNLGQYTQPAPAQNPAVAQYNQILANRAAQEYVAQPAPLSLLPGGGERATPEDTRKIINEYYLKNLGRQGEQAGLDYWAKQKAETGMSLADINKAIGESGEANIRNFYKQNYDRYATPEEIASVQQRYASGEAPEQIMSELQKSSPKYKAYESAPITKANFDAAAYLAANPDIKRLGEYEADPFLHYERHGKAEGRVAPRVAFQPTPAVAPASKSTGYTFDPVTGRYTKPEMSAQNTGLPGIDLNDPGFQNFIQQQYAQYQAAQSGGGSGGGKAGGLMPAALKYNMGGDIPNLGSYSDGGRLLKGPGDGMSDNIPAMIGKKQPARLADGEFVVPADVVSHLGNGSTDAGAKRLYAMMDKVRKARTGNKKQGKQIKADKFIPV